MIRCICFALCLMLLQGRASADWVELARGAEGIFFFDPSLVKKLPDGKISSWIKIGVTPNSEKAKMLEAAGLALYPHSLSRLVTDCSTWQVAITSTRYYTNDEKLIGEQNNLPWEFNDIVPRSLTDALAEAVCKKYTKQ